MKVAVIGAGTMGSGIAQTFAQCDEVETVYLCDIKEEFAEGGLGKVKKNLDKLVSKGKMDQAKADAIIGKFKTGLNTLKRISLRIQTAFSHQIHHLFQLQRSAQA